VIWFSFPTSPNPERDVYEKNTAGKQGVNETADSYTEQEEHRERNLSSVPAACEAWQDPEDLVCGRFKL
jgi:hypothetical protein